jgi:ABC-type Mn2+/Zn2+ transport system permease subunit
MEMGESGRASHNAHVPKAGHGAPSGDGVKRETRFLIAILLGGLSAFVSTLALWRDFGEMVGSFLLLFSLPGFIVAFLLGAIGLVGNAHDPNIIVIAVVDGLFYALLFYWLMTRRFPRER